jgi:hypothetical protein
MTKKLSLIFIAILSISCFITINTSHAITSKKVFVIENVAVDETSSTALKAREKALEIGQKSAWKKLLERMTFPEAAKNVAGISYSELRSLIRGYEVIRERTSTVRYLAELNVTFNTNAVRQFFLNNNIDYAETPSAPVLVIPILMRQGVASLWESPNPWRDAWQNLPKQRGLVDILVPTGDLADIRDIAAIQALRGDQKKLRKMAERYHAKTVIVAKAFKRFGIKDNLPILEIIITKIESDQVEETIIDTIKGEIGDDLLDLLGVGVTRVVNSLVGSWKEENAVTTGLLLRVPIVVPINGLNNWLEIKSQLDEIGILKRTNLRRLSKREAFLDLWVSGNITLLENALSPKNLSLLKHSKGFTLSHNKNTIPEKNN